jgi:hypothetical protein
MINKINKSNKTNTHNNKTNTHNNKTNKLHIMKGGIIDNNIVKNVNEIKTDGKTELEDRGSPPEYNNENTTFFSRFVYILKYVWQLYKYYVWYSIKTHKIEVSLILTLIAYIILVVSIFTHNPYDLITEKNGGMSIFISLFGGFLFLLAIFYYIRRKELFPDETKYERASTNLSFIGKIFTSVVTIAIVLGTVYLLFNAASYFNDFSKYFTFGINILIFIGLGTIIYKIISNYTNEGVKNNIDKNPSWVGLFFKVIGYIPCLILQLVDYIKDQYHITSNPILILLLVEAVLIMFYFAYPVFMDIIMLHNAELLLNTPENLNTEKNLGTFQKLNFVNDKFQYKYAVSGWVYLDSFPPETNPNYEKYTTIINIGNKPNVSYNVLKNKLRIKMENQGKKEEFLYETDNFYMQKWNHIVINYDGSTLDIFINNELVSSTTGVVPYNGNTIMSTGFNGGLSGGVCNVRYFKESISRGKISWLYNSAKNLSPPVI